MAAEDIKQHQFTSENQPANRGRKKGVPNRATIFKRLLKMKVETESLETGEKVQLSLYEAMALAQCRAALNGNTRAWIEIQDTLHGKLTDKHEVGGPEEGGLSKQLEVKINQVYSVHDLTDEQLQAIALGQEPPGLDELRRARGR